MTADERQADALRRAGLLAAPEEDTTAPEWAVVNPPTGLMAELRAERNETRAAASAGEQAFEAVRSAFRTTVWPASVRELHDHLAHVAVAALTACTPQPSQREALTADGIAELVRRMNTAETDRDRLRSEVVAAGRFANERVRDLQTEFGHRQRGLLAALWRTLDREPGTERDLIETVRSLAAGPQPTEPSEPANADCPNCTVPAEVCAGVSGCCEACAEVGRLSMHARRAAPQAGEPV